MLTPTQPSNARNGADLINARRRLGLTQEELAVALRVSIRTVQDWESNVATSQLENETKDLWKLLNLMDDYVIANEEQNWLKSPNSALRNRTPQELIVEGNLRDLIVEFQRLREGQPI